MILTGAYFVFLGEDKIGEVIINELPTDFAEIGNFVINIPSEDESDLPRIVYEEPGAPALTKKLVFDELSVCQSENRAVMCVAMSVTLDIPFGGKRVLVEGVRQAEDKVLVRRIKAFREGELEFEPILGSIFISWHQARELILGCRVSAVMQTHALDIYLTLKDGREIRAVEPTIDEIFRVVDEAKARCGAIQLATE